ncbi:MAG: CsgG/HfaB family protein [Opitutaceae bacterium]
MKLPLLLISAGILVSVGSLARAQTGPSGLLKKGTATTTSDDGAGSKMAVRKGVKHAIGVSDFTNDARYHAWSELGGNLKFMLESALAETGRFVMVERINLGTVVAEQDLQKSGRAAEAKSVAETGKLRSARTPALVVSLPPGGGYTVQVSGSDGGTGEALVEIYEVQP